MAEQSASGTVASSAGDTGAHGLDAHIGSSGAHAVNHGRRSSWVAVSTIIVGFTVGGIAMVTGPTWWLFWAGGAIAALGGLYGLSVHILDDWY